jgi:hypothetical protein
MDWSLWPDFVELLRDSSRIVAGCCYGWWRGGEQASTALFVQLKACPQLGPAIGWAVAAAGRSIPQSLPRYRTGTPIRAMPGLRITHVQRLTARP